MDISLNLGPYGVILLLGVILVLTKALGELFERITLPAIFGEILLGVILGPLSGIIVLCPPEGGKLTLCAEIIKILGELGAIFLLFSIGFTKIDAKKLTVKTRQVLPVTILGAAFPFAATFIVTYLFSSTIFSGTSALKGSLLIGTALAATSIGVSVRTLMDLRYIATMVGATVLVSAVLDSFLSLCILGIVSGIVKTGTISYLDLTVILCKLSAFGAIVFLVGRFLFPVLARLSSKMLVEEATFGIIIGTLFLFAFLTERFGLSLIIGAFLFGVSISMIPRLKTEMVVHKVGGLANGFFVPFFFLNIGLLFDFKVINQMGIFSIILLLALIVSQIIGGFLGAKISRFPTRDAFIVGIALIPRNELALVITAIGLELGVLGSKIFSTLVLLSIATTIITPLLLRVVIRKEDRHD